MTTLEPPRRTQRRMPRMPLGVLRIVPAAVWRSIDACAYLLFGIRPLVHLRSSETVTGDTTDDRLVVTVGTLRAVIGGTMIVAALRRARRTPRARW